MENPNKISIKNKDCMIWARDKSWYYIDDEQDKVILTEQAPEEARQSFEKWKKLNNINWSD